MAAKYQLITELYRRTGIAVAKNPQAWQSFLAAACRNYKCRFDEQLLIYAQRPDAIAVAELDTWNKRFKRWVNKDSKGIAVFDPKGRRNTLKYYFDVSDTHDGYYGSRPVPIWQMNGRYEQAVIERLSDRFGNTESTDLASALMETAKNAVEDNLQDYFSQLKGFTRDSFLEELDDLNVEVCYRRLVTNSVAFMLMSRCGLDTTEHFDREDFENIINFNTPATINALGIATSDISEMALKEISLAIQNLQIAEKGTNRTFVPESKSQYNKGRIQPERSENNERNHLQQAGRLSYSRPDITDRARNSAWQIRSDAQALSGAAQASDLSQSGDIGQTERVSVSDRTDGSPEVGASDEAAFSRTGRDGGAERESPDAVGTENEQHPQSSGGSDYDRADLQVNVHFKTPTAPTYMEQLKQMETDGLVSLRGLRKDATIFNEIVIDVNTMYFERNGGYEYAKQFYEEAFHFIEEKFGAENVISAVMHADEINIAATEELGKEVYHYHLHAMVLPVVEKEILWSKRCKDEKLRGTVKEVVHQISHSKKWKSDIPLTDEKGNPLLRKNGKPMFRASYSILQDELFNHMTEQGFKGFQRGEYGSTAEHLTSLQYQIKQDKERLEKLQKRIQHEQIKYEPARNVSKTYNEIDRMGQKTITGKMAISKEDYSELTALAKEGITSRAEISELEQSANYYRQKYFDCANALERMKTKYNELKEKCRPFLQALEHFPEVAKLFTEKVKQLFSFKEAQERAEKEAREKERQERIKARRNKRGMER